MQISAELAQASPVEFRRSSRFGWLDIVRCLLCLLAATFLELVGGALLEEPLRNLTANFGDDGMLASLSIVIFLDYFVLDFLVIYLALFIMRKKYRVIAGVLILYGLFLFLLSGFEVGNWVGFLVRVVQLSASATGAILAILLHYRPGREPKKTVNQVSEAPLEQLLAAQARNIGKKAPKLPKALLSLALLSVPSTYIVLVISSFIVLGLSIWALTLVLQLPRIPIYLLVGLGIAPFVGLGIAIKALWATFKTKPNFETAVKLSDPQKFKLFEVVQEVCKRVGTKMPSNILLHSDPNFFVTNARLETYDGVVSGRTLAIGIPLLLDLNADELKAVLAHEFSHFTGNDTAYSIIVSPVYNSISSALKDIAGFGTSEGKEGSSIVNVVAILLLIPRLFLSVFLEYFALIDRILSRNRELRADWYAASYYGSSVLGTALLKVAEIGRHFGETSNALAVTETDSFFQLYSRSLKQPGVDLARFRRDALSEASEDFDTHPPLSDRLIEMPFSPSIALGATSAATVVEDLREEEKRLSNFYTASVKAVRKYYDDLEKVSKEPDKYLRYDITIYGSRKLAEHNGELIRDLSVFAGTDFATFEQQCKNNPSIEIAMLSTARATELVELLKRHGLERDIAVRRRILDENVATPT